jgi:hypothetical protein
MRAGSAPTSPALKSLINDKESQMASKNPHHEEMVALSESDCKHNPSPPSIRISTHRMQISATGWGGIVGVTLIVALMLYVMV